jgi:hypothetical protein
MSGQTNFRSLLVRALFADASQHKMFSIQVRRDKTAAWPIGGASD